MQFQFLKGRYCLSFVVLCNFGRAPVNSYAAHGHLINKERFPHLYDLAIRYSSVPTNSVDAERSVSQYTAVNAPQRQSFSDMNLALQVMATFNARDETGGSEHNLGVLLKAVRGRPEPSGHRPDAARSRPDAARVCRDSNPCMTVPIKPAASGLSVVTVGWLLELSFKKPYKMHSLMA